MKKSEILRDAKRQLWDGEGGRGEQYICIAIEYDGDILRDEVDEVIDLKADVRERLCGWGSYEEYLVHLHGDGYSYSLTHVQIQAMRHKLLDEMIAEYEGRGE